MCAETRKQHVVRGSGKEGGTFVHMLESTLKYFYLFCCAHFVLQFLLAFSASDRSLDQQTHQLLRRRRVLLCYGLHWRLMEICTYVYVFVCIYNRMCFVFMQLVNGFKRIKQQMQLCY